MERAKKRCPKVREDRDDKLRRIAELIRNDEYVIDPDLLADAILKHLGMAARGGLRAARRRP